MILSRKSKKIFSQPVTKSGYILINHYLIEIKTKNRIEKTPMSFHFEQCSTATFMPIPVVGLRELNCCFATTESVV